MNSSFKLMLFAFILFMNTPLVLAQHIKIDEKIFSFLEDADVINVLFTFEDLMIDGDLTESEFLIKMNNKITKLASIEEANIWKKSYENHKDSIWGNAFLKMFNKRNTSFKNSPIFVTNNQNTKYTMKANATWMYYGYDAGIVDRPAKVTLHITFYENNEPSKIIAETTISRAEGKYNKTDGDGEGKGPSLNRMRKAYIKAGFKLSQALKRVLD